jgi:hypothetical protein
VGLKVKTIPIEKFGKDHWSLLAFIECLCVDNNGNVDDANKMRMRCNEQTHPQYLVRPRGGLWSPKYGTRLKGFFDKYDPKLQLPKHDDWNCVEDLEAGGLVKRIGTGINPVFELTIIGKAIATKLREHKASGGMFATFNLG